MQTRGFASKLLIAGLLLLGSFGTSEAQVSVNRKYRVIAYKTGSPQIFSVSNEVNIIPNMSIYIPNTFTPNGDGLNDTFGVAGEAILEFNMKIFNRWGESLYQTKRIGDGWDGTYKGKQLTPDVYVYIVEVVCDNNSILTFKGNIALIK